MSQTKQPAAAQRRLELELIRVRAEAAAVRLEARAAEIELMLLGSLPASPLPPNAAEPLDASTGSNAEFTGSNLGFTGSNLGFTGPNPGFTSAADGSTEAAEALLQAIRELLAGRRLDGEWPEAPDAAASHDRPEPVSPAFLRSDQPMPGGANRELLDFLTRRSAHSSSQLDSIRLSAEPSRPDDSTTDLSAPGRTRSSTASQPAKNDRPASENASASHVSNGHESAGHASTGGSPGMVDVPGDGEQRQRPGQPPRPNRREVEKRAVEKREVEKRTVEKRAAEKRLLEKPIGTVSAGGKALPIAVESDGSRPIGDRRRRPAVWLVSTLAHAGVLLALGLMTLANPLPRDQLAFSASTAEASEEPIETFTIETSESVVEESLPEPSEAVLDISPLGELPIAEVTLDLPAVPPPLAASMRESFTSSTKRLSAAPSSKQPNRVQFAGIDGGGNHFAYLVDSSKSMKRFDEARLELLRSIDSLQPDQRFYVVFYDQTPEPMRLTDPSRDEPGSVLATREHKLALRRWAMTIGQQRGKSPTEVLPTVFALRPDVIFLLSDGQFSARTEEVIREHNRIENLFGDSRSRSIIHTIRYPGTSNAEVEQAEVQMRRIAAENGGQYRNVELP